MVMANLILVIKTTVEHEKKERIEFSYFLNIGIVPDICRHTCDTKDCVNPAHLLNGTQKDNMRDMFERGRQPVFNQAGELNGNSRLTEDQVKEIRNRYLPYKSYSKNPC